MKKLPVALQVYSVRDYAEKDFEGTMEKVKSYGYDGVELAGLYGLAPETIRDVLAKVGLKPVSAHVPYGELVGDMHGTIAKYKTIGCPFIAIPYLEDSLRPGTDAFAGVVKNIEKIGKACKEQGMQLLYHNHEFEFMPMPDGVYALDYLYATVSEDILKTEIDTCWVNFAGEDPVAYVRKYTGRSPIVHLKDYVSDGPRGYNVPRSGFEFRPVGHGVQDMPAILEASVDAGAQWVVVEQDMSVGRTTLEAAKMSREYLATQGL